MTHRNRAIFGLLMLVALAACTVTPLFLDSTARPINRVVDAKDQWTKVLATINDARAAGLVSESEMKSYVIPTDAAVWKLLNDAQAVARNGGSVEDYMQKVRNYIRAAQSWLAARENPKPIKAAIPLAMILALIDLGLALGERFSPAALRKGIAATAQRENRDVTEDEIALIDQSHEAERQRAANPLPGAAPTLIVPPGTTQGGA